MAGMIGVSVLGATGSIGMSTLDVLRRHPQRYRVVGLSANTDDERLAEQCRIHHPDYAVMADELAAQRLRERLRGINGHIEVLAGTQGLETIAALPQVECVMAAIVGAAGLVPALAAVREARAAKRFVPGLGHPIHKVTDPRTPVLIKIAEEEGLRGPHLRLFEAIGRVHPQVLGRTLPLNGAGTCGAALADLGLPADLLRGFALLARTAGLLGHVAEEKRRPIGMDVYLNVEHNAEYLPPSE